MKNISLLFLLLMLTSCKSQETKKETSANQHTTTEETSTKKQQKPMLIGIKNRSDLQTQPYNTWFSKNYENYTVDAATTQKLKPILKNVKIKLFMGTWCGDSKREVPRFYKIMDAADFDFKKLTLITMSRKKDTPKKHEEGLNITNVPTFIFYKDGKEINRIVELPIESLEKDMLAILSGNDYKHAYAE